MLEHVDATLAVSMAVINNADPKWLATAST